MCPLISPVRVSPWPQSSHKIPGSSVSRPKTFLRRKVNKLQCSATRWNSFCIFLSNENVRQNGITDRHFGQKAFTTINSSWRSWNSGHLFCHHLSHLTEQTTPTTTWHTAQEFGVVEKRKDLQYSNIVWCVLFWINLYLLLFVLWSKSNSHHAAGPLCNSSNRCIAPGRTSTGFIHLYLWRPDGGSGWTLAFATIMIISPGGHSPSLPSW